MPGRPLPSVFRELETLVAIPDYQKDHSCRETEDITENFTGDIIGHMPRATEEDALAAVERARKAQKAWAQVPVKERAWIFRRYHQLILGKREESADIIQCETGKARAAALEEIMDVSINARYYSNHGPAMLKPKRVPGMLPVVTKTVVYRKPKGVVGVVAPWNYPFNLAISDAIPAMIAGNTIVLKPDSQTPYSALRCAKLLYQAGVPRDVFQVVTGRGSVVGNVLANNCDYLMFTGSTKTGKLLGEQTGRRLVNYSAELGGKNAMIVQKGADLKNCAEVSMRGMFSNSGQLCISIERVYVERDIYQDFLKALKERLDKLVIAANYDYATEYGSIISQQQMDTIESHIKDAVEKGATIFWGGKRLPEVGPLYIQPTILIDVPEDALCRTKETFGPLVSVYPVDSIEEAIERANDTNYGLNSSVWGKTYHDGEEIARQLNTGTVSVNEGYGPGWASVHAPMGGYKESGVGRRHGKDGILKYTESTTVATQRLVSMGGPSFIPLKIWNGKILPIIAHIINT